MDYKTHYEIDAEAFDYFAENSNPDAEKRRCSYIFSLLQDCWAHKKVIDIGAGNGWLAFYLFRRNAEVWALDLGKNNLRKINQKEPKIHTLNADAYELPFSSASFDLIAANEVLEHLEDPQKALCHWYDKLKPAGTLLVSVPYRETIRYNLCVHCNKVTPQNAHLHSFTENKLKRMLKKAGYEISSSHFFLHKIWGHLGFYGLLRFLPDKIFFAFDRILLAFSRKPKYLSIKAVKGKV